MNGYNNNKLRLPVT